MIKAAFVRVRRDKVDRLRAWSEELQARAEESDRHSRRRAPTRSAPISYTT
jgi:hypothetical protein